VCSPDLPFALGLFDDQRAFLARSFAPGAGDAQHLRVLEELPGTTTGGSILTGYNPPWVRKALEEIPSDACALLLGEIPAVWRKRLTKILELRVCPRTFVLYALRQADGYTLFLSLNLDRAGDEVKLCQDLDKWRLRSWHGPLTKLSARKRSLWALEPIEETLNAVQWGSREGGRCVRTKVEIRGPVYRRILTSLRALSRAVE
jgi:hypothetical protein